MPDLGRLDTGDPEASGHDTTGQHASGPSGPGQPVPSSWPAPVGLAPPDPTVAEDTIPAGDRTLEMPAVAVRRVLSRRRLGWIAVLTACVALAVHFWPSADLLGHHDDVVSAVAVGQVNGRPVVVTGDGDGAVRVRDLSAYTRFPILGAQTIGPAQPLGRRDAAMVLQHRENRPRGLAQCPGDHADGVTGPPQVLFRRVRHSRPTHPSHDPPTH